MMAWPKQEHKPQTQGDMKQKTGAPSKDRRGPRREIPGGQLFAVLKRAQKQNRTPEMDTLRTITALLSVTVSSLLPKDRMQLGLTQIFSVFGSSWQCTDCSRNPSMSLNPLRPITASPHRSVFWFFGSTLVSPRYNSEYGKRIQSSPPLIIFLPNLQYLACTKALRDAPNLLNYMFPGCIHDLARWPPTIAIWEYQWR